MIVREMARRPQQLAQRRRPRRLPAPSTACPGIGGIDTRRLTRHIPRTSRRHARCAFGTADEVDARRRRLTAEPGTDGGRPGQPRSPPPSPMRSPASDQFRIVAYDFGIKTTILRHLAGLGTVEVVPASTSCRRCAGPPARTACSSPTDPATRAPCPTPSRPLEGLLGEVPIFGICLGHQLLATALGGEITKLPFGHHGGNHPVRHIATGRVEITSQNHNFAVADDSVPDAVVTHRNLNDGVVEGISSLEAPSVQRPAPPRSRPRPPTSRPICSPSSPTLMASFTEASTANTGQCFREATGGHMPRRDDISSILLIGVGADRDRAGV